MTTSTRLRSLELCAGAGGLALGLENAGFTPSLLVETDGQSLETLKANRPNWPLLQEDLSTFDPAQHPEAFDVDLLSAGTPRVKSVATINRPEDEAERKLVTAALYLVGAVGPKAVIIENVPGLVDGADFADVRAEIRAELEHLGYRLFAKVLNAMHYGVPQDRKHGFFVALKEPFAGAFTWPEPLPGPAPTVGDALHASMAEQGWPHAHTWAAHAQRVAPTLVGGSDKRGGADLGPARAKKIWQEMGINGGTVADSLPGPDTPWDPTGDRKNLPALTVPQTALLQGFPSDWVITGLKTRSYRQVGQAVPRRSPRLSGGAYSQPSPLPRRARAEHALRRLRSSP
ncbi:DNA cytosine methyltransferase [Streptomyces sp. MST-110588]|uniref:DNA cytosine methyltransferase n=1 Tax=Streptomyces sp. MST-110588 TaxID=2833628 RepID=UPI0032420698